MKKTLMVVAMLFSIPNALLADTDRKIPLEISISHDDNLNRSPDNSAAIDSLFYTLGTGYHYTTQLDTKSFINFHLLAKYEDYSDTEGLNNTQGTAGLSYHFKPNPGFTSATYIFKFDIRASDFETDKRDRTTYEAGALMSFWMTNITSMRIGINSRLHISDSSVFDTRDHRLFLNADIILDRSSTIYSTLNYLHGDIVSTVDATTFGSDILNIIRQGNEIEFDTTFGDNMLAYRVETNVYALTLGYNYILAPRQSLDFSVRYVYGDAHYDIDYETTFINLSYLVSFKL